MNGAMLLSLSLALLIAGSITALFFIPSAHLPKGVRYGVPLTFVIAGCISLMIFMYLIGWNTGISFGTQLMAY